MFRGAIRIPFAQVLTNQWACSGSCQTLPFRLDAHTNTFFDKGRIFENYRTQQPLITVRTTIAYGFLVPTCERLHYSWFQSFVCHQ